MPDETYQNRQRQTAADATQPQRIALRRRELHKSVIARGGDSDLDNTVEDLQRSKISTVEAERCFAKVAQKVKKLKKE